MEHHLDKKILDVDEIRLKLHNEYICEKWSRSDEIDNAVSKIYKCIQSTIGESSVNSINTGLDLYVGNCECSLFGENVVIEYYAYNADSDENIQEVINGAYSRNGYDEATKEFIITIYLVNGEVIEPVSTKNVSHELEHMLQIQYAKKSNKNYKQLNGSEYQYASEVLDSEASSQIAKKIAWLFYYSNRHEQDALMNEYYEDLRNNRQFIIDKDSEMHSRLFSYEYLGEWAKIYNTEEFVKELAKYKKFGYNRNAFLVMVEKGIKRFKKKMKNVEKHFENRVAYLNEQKRHYTEKAIGRMRRIEIP